jgi:probable selenium-dependent hydroxylase accessory protein YqeC
MRLSDTLIIPRGITAVVGGGGKTTLIFRLAQELSEQHQTLITTTAHMWPPQCKTLFSPSKQAIEQAFYSHNLLAVGELTPEGKLAPVPELLTQLNSLGEYVLVEADGSRGLPLKAPAEHEPVLPEHTALTVAVAGMSCCGLTPLMAAHRQELYAERSGIAMNECVTPQAVANVLGSPLGQRKNVKGRYLVVLNQADTPERLAFARDVAGNLHEDVAIVALQNKPDWCELWVDGKPIYGA